MEQPKIPTLKDAQKPQVKIKGMGAGLTLFDRLKQFKKKDLAFILAGLGTLFMAPLAEHFMMAPENGDMAAGFRGGANGGRGIWGDGSSPYENGNNNIAQGGAIGGGGDIITPLNVRDPSALVMGPGSAQQPPAGSGAAVTPPPTAPETKSSDYRDALAGAATRAASAATKKAPLPIPKIAVGGSGLRGLGAASGGSSSGSGSLGNIGGLGGGQAGTGGGGLNLVRNAPNFKGVAGPRGPNSPSGLDGTKRAGANAGDNFSRTGSALGGLNAAASEQIPTGGQGFGGGGQGGAGANDKPGGGAGAAGSKSVGESLAFIEAKERMMENLKLEFEKRKLKDTDLLLYGIRNDTAKAIASELTKMSMKKLGDMWSAKDAAGNTMYICGTSIADSISIPLATESCKGKTPATDCMDTGGTTYITPGGKSLPCKKMGDGTAKPAPNAETATASPPPAPTVTRPTAGEVTTQGELEGLCLKLRTSIETINGQVVAARNAAANTPKPATTPAGAAAAPPTLSAANAGDLATVKTMLNSTAKLVAVRNALYGGGPNNCATGEHLNGAVVSSYKDTPASKYYDTTVAALVGDGKAEKGGIGTLEGIVAADKGDAIATGDGQFVKAEGELAKAEAIRKDAETIMKGVQDDQFVSLPGSDAEFMSLSMKAKETRVSLDKLVTADDKLTKDYTKLIAGAKLASSADPITSKLVVEQNQAFLKKKEAVEKLGVTVEAADIEPKKPEVQPGSTPAAPAPAASGDPDWAKLAAQVKAKAEAVPASLQAVQAKVDLATAEADDTKKKKLADEAKGLLKDAATPLKAMRDEQTTFLTGLRGGISNVGRPAEGAR